MRSSANWERVFVLRGKWVWGIGRGVGEARVLGAMGRGLELDLNSSIHLRERARERGVFFLFFF